MKPEDTTPDEQGAREERLFQLSEELQASFEAGNTHTDSVWALRFDLEEAEVARVRRGLELLFFDEEEVEGHDLPAALETLAPPELPADYLMRGELGRGGMGVVYRVHQVSLDRELALKVLRPGEMQARRAIERFKREARSLARLRHPHIASLHEVGECEGRVYFTMDLIEGQSLASLLKEGAVTPSRASRWTRQLASALQYVHSHGLVHRDIKPANILIDEEDNACLVDFGLARDVEVSSDLTMSGHFLGTPAYMAPEQVRGQKEAVGESADIYALGAVLYECLTGKRAFSGQTLVQVIHAVAGGKFVPPSQVDGKVPAGLELICLKAMSREAADRYATARALLEDLESFEAGRRVLARPPSALHQARDVWQRNLPSMRVAVGTVVVMVVVFGLLLLGPLGGMRFEKGLLAEAQELALADQPHLAVGMFERYFPESMEGAALGSIGLGYCDALLFLCEEANLSGAESQLVERAEQVLSLVKRAKDRISRESRWANPKVNELLAEWQFRAVEASAYLKDESQFENHWKEFEQDTAYVRRDSSADRSPRPVWEAPGSKETRLARALIPDLLDRNRAHHERAVRLWSAGLSARMGRWKAGPELRGLLEQCADKLPDVLLAVLAATPNSIWVKSDEVPFGGRNWESDGWVEAIGHCDTYRLREVLMQGLSRTDLSTAALARVKRLCRVVLELPDISTPLEDRTELRGLLDPEGYAPQQDLPSRAEYLLKFSLTNGGISQTTLLDWLQDVTGAVPPQVDPRSGTAEEVRKRFSESVRKHCAELRTESLGRAVTDAVNGLDSASSARARRVAHERLRFVLTDDALAGKVLPPIWAGEDPAQLANRWHALLAPDSMQGKRRIRLAAIRYDFAEALPHLRHVQEFEVSVGEPWRVQVLVPVPALCEKPGDGILDILGLHNGASWSEVELSGRLDWGQGGLRLSWDSPQVATNGTGLSPKGSNSLRAGLPGSINTASNLAFRREAGGPELLNEFLVLHFLDSSQDSSDWDAVAWQSAADLRATAFSHDWVTAETPAQREALTQLPGFRRLDADLKEALLLRVLERGAPLSAAEGKALAGLEEGSSKRRLKGGILWAVVLVAVFILLGGLIGGLLHVSIRRERAKYRAEMESRSQDELDAMAPGLLVTTVMFAWYPTQIPLAWYWGRMALFSLLSGVACRHSRSPWKWVPSAAAGLAALSFLVVDWSGTDGLRDPRSYVIPIVLYLVGIFALPLVFDEYWSWHPDPVKGPRLRKIANYIFFSGFVVPISAMFLFGYDVTQVMMSGSRGLSAYGFHLVVFLGLEVWIACLMRATSKRSREIVKQGMERRKAAKLAGTASA